jgi:N-acetylneuraminate synthase
MNDIQIGTKYISDEHLPFIVAEMSGNHNQSLERALSIVDAAAATGADALKIQTYTADTITLDVEDGDFFITDEKSLWKGRSLHDLYTEAFTPWEWHKSIYDRCRKHGIICFSTPFDESAVDFLESLETPCYKIASFENAHLPLIRKVASTGKPIIISTGLATLVRSYDGDRHIDCSRCYGCTTDRKTFHSQENRWRSGFNFFTGTGRDEYSGTGNKTGMAVNWYRAVWGD